MLSTKKLEFLRWGIPFLLLLGLYFLTRFVSIRTLPPFNDEFIYVRWAQEGFFDPAKRFLSLTDGKQPLFVWLVMILMNFISSPMAAGRIVSIVSGGATLLGIGIFSYLLYGSRAIAVFAAFLYIVYPQALILDRFALYDSLLAALSIWSMIVLRTLFRNPNPGTVFVLGHVLGLALLTKSSALLFILYIPLLYVFSPKHAKSHHLTIMLHVVCAVLLAFIYQSVQLVSPFGSFMSEKNSLFVYPLKELMGLSMISVFRANVTLYTSWIVTYVTIPILVSAVSPFITDKKHTRIHLLLLSLFLVPFLAVAVVGKTIYPRHLFFMSLPILILAANGISVLWNTFRLLWQRIVIAIFIFIYPIVSCYSILWNVTRAPIPAVDKLQYVNGWSAGWGVKDIVQFLDRESRIQQIIVVTEGKYGSLPTTSMALYFGQNPNVILVAIDDDPLYFPVDLDWRKPVYIILNKTQSMPANWEAKEVMRIRKGSGDSFIQLYRVTKNTLD